MDWPAWRGRFRPPLGRPHSGTCRAEPPNPILPDAELLMDCCNVGYARGRCERVPAAADDAVRFSHGPSGEVRWSFERNHLPAHYGTTVPGEESGQGSVLDSQIAAFAAAIARPWHRR